MDRETRRKFNEQIGHYRIRLDLHAKKCDWEKFKLDAGRLFDYAEAIELSETRRRFLNVFRIILVLVVVCALYLFSPDPASILEIPRVKRAVIAAGAGGAFYDLFFYMNYRYYINAKALFYEKRRLRFIRGLEQDFKGECPPREGRHVADVCRRPKEGYGLR
jgi:hypothetical protein